MSANEARLYSAELLDPRLLNDRRGETGIQPTVAVETAWCFEFHTHLAEAIAARSPGAELILMGGHASSLRLIGLGRSRGSRDTDYLTSLDEATAVAAFESALASVRAAASASLPAIPDGAFEAERLRGGANAIPLPLVSYRITVPAVIELGRATAQIKVELHLVPAAELPPSEPLTDTPFPLTVARTLRVPALPWQIAYKATTLAAPPVGIPLERAAQLSRQLYDLDHLGMLFRDGDAQTLRDAVARVYATEARYAGENIAAGAPWTGIDARLGELADDMAAGGDGWRYANQFQSAQVARAARLTQPAWTARIDRIRLFVRLAREERLDTFGRLCDIDQLLPIARGGDARTFTAVRTHLGRGRSGSRATNRDRFWEYLLEEGDLLQAAEAVAALVPAPQ